MKKLLIWTVLTAFVMLGAPWLTVTYAFDAGFGIMFLLFYLINPLFSAVCGVIAGANTKRLWPLPIIVAVLFLAGTWLFFEMGEPDFLLYGGCYLVIGSLAMGITALIRHLLRH